LRYKISIKNKVKDNALFQFFEREMIYNNQLGDRVYFAQKRLTKPFL
jgi:hypothetical protein